MNVVLPAILVDADHRVQVSRWRERYVQYYATHKHPAVQQWLAKHPRFNRWR